MRRVWCDPYLKEENDKFGMWRKGINVSQYMKGVGWNNI